LKALKVKQVQGSNQNHVDQRVFGQKVKRVIQRQYQDHRGECDQDHQAIELLGSVGIRQNQGMPLNLFLPLFEIELFLPAQGKRYQ
jgi:hypothetical protein